MIWDMKTTAPRRCGSIQKSVPPEPPPPTMPEG